MRFDPNRCLNCSDPTRYAVETYWPFQDVVRPNGNVLDTCFWFCSDACVVDVLDKDVDQRYRHDKSVFKDPDLPANHIEEYVAGWKRAQNVAYRQAARRLAERAAAEYVAYADNYERQAAKELATLEKKMEASVQHRARLLGQLEKDRERREEEEIAFARLVTKAEYENKEMDRRAAEALQEEREKQERKRAEEQRWKPRPFKW